MAEMKFGKLEPEFQQPYMAFSRDPNPHNTSQMLTALKPVIQSGVKSHVGKVNPISTSQARKLTLQAMKTYDPTKAKLSTHVHNHLQGLRRLTRQQTSGVRVPERIALDHGHMMRAIAELEDDLGREPTTDELADYSRLSRKRIAQLRKFQPGVAQGTLTAAGEAGQAGWNPAVQQESDAWLRLVHSDMDATNQKIMEWTFGLYGSPQLSNQAIAQRLKLSPGAISQRKANIQRILDQEQDLSVF